MTQLAMGANAPISSPTFTLDVDLPTGGQIDVTALLLYGDGKVRGDGDMCFFNQTSIGGGAVSLRIQGDRQSFSFDLGKMPPDVEKIVVNATLENGAFSAVADLDLTTSDGIKIPVATAGRSEAALILCEIYRRNDQWKIRNVSQGFNGGLQALAEHFGVEVAAPEPTPVKPTPSVDLSKVSLTKRESTISLKKDDGKFGRIRINLNWNQKKTSGGLFGFGKRGIDLDLGAFIEFKTGEFGVVQALGDCFGDLTEMPFTQLMSDDRTGTSTDGEWLEIDGNAWPKFKRILIFAFIYEGVANWQETDGVIRLMVPGQPEVEVRMNELSAGRNEGMCAVALLENKDNQIRINREVRFFTGHEAMDNAYDWGMRWKAGRK
ncbi:TerD family protein [Oceaniglobus ichthyenteri]|uniref:TerD family protein n=1 Tax=Oceaniglobus ichthyenteri TaxID=2136177 RepID=UPI000D3B7D59|nr:TerD family protein [Oceaniglobus ichthyenteri]